MRVPEGSTASCDNLGTFPTPGTTKLIWPSGAFAFPKTPETLVPVDLEKPVLESVVVVKVLNVSASL